MAALFFFSGALALVYEVLWQRRFALVFGSGAPASAAVLAATFAGLGLGSLIVGRAAARWPRPLRAYAVLEIAIGAGAVLAAVLTVAFDRIYPRLFAGVGAQPAAFLAAKTLLAFVALALPTFAMGGTLPVLAAWADRGARHLGLTAGLLYVANTAGAGAGALAVPFVLLPKLGAAGTLAAAVAGNVLLAAVALLMDRTASDRRGEMSLRPLRSSTPSAVKEPNDILILALVSGVVTFVLQVLWNRAFAQVHENSVHAFAVVAALFILALAVGGHLARVVLRRGIAAERVIGWSWLLASVLMALSPALFVRLTGGLDYLPTDRGWWAAGTRLAAIALPTVFLPVALLGMALPALMERAGRHASADAGQVLGRVLAVNVVGCVAGALAAGFVLPSLLGLWRSTAVVGLVIAVAAAAVLHRAGSRGGPARVPSVVAIVVALAALAADPPRVRLDAGRGERLVALAEGTHGITAVLEDTGYRRLKLNNWYVLGGTAVTGDERMQAHVPLLLHPAPRRVAFLGLGSGITASGALFHPVEQLTAVELVPEVARAAEEHLGDANLHVLRDPRTRLVLDDARGHLRGTPDRFDVVVGDLVVPWRPGESALFTLEHFEAARRVLAPGGTFCQWLPLFQLSDDELHSILRTFLEVFPHAQVWRGDFSPDEPAVALVAGRNGVTLDPALVARRLREMRPDPTNAGLAEPVALWLHFVGILDAPEFESAPAPINRELDPWIETRGPLARGRAQARMTGRRAEAWMAEVRRRSAKRVGPLGPSERAAMEAGEALLAFSLALSEGDDTSARAAHARLAALVPPAVLSAVFASSAPPSR